MAMAVMVFNYAGAPMKSQIWDLVPNGTKVQIWSQKSPNFACKSQIDVNLVKFGIILVFWYNWV